MKNTILVIASILLIISNIHSCNQRIKEQEYNRAFSRKLFELSYKAGQANEAYKVYMFRVNHVHFSADSMYKVDSLKIDSMICEHF